LPPRDAGNGDLISRRASEMNTMDRSSIYLEFAKLAPERRVTKLAEESRKDGTTIDMLVNDLRINCVWNYMDLSVAVTTAIEADSWTGGWAAVYFLFAYFEGTNDPDAAVAIENSPRQITWLIENFDKVYLLMCDPSCDEQKRSFFTFQENEFKERSDKAVRSFRQSRPI
jgi:hypothetical protein